MVQYDCTTDAGLCAVLADTNVPMIGRRFGSLHASLVARYPTAVPPCACCARVRSAAAARARSGLWTFDCFNEQQANELASKVDRNAVIVVRVHWCHPGAGTWGLLPVPPVPH